jgi:hypothetical protein
MSLYSADAIVGVDRINRAGAAEEQIHEALLELGIYVCRDSLLEIREHSRQLEESWKKHLKSKAVMNAN